MLWTRMVDAVAAKCQAALMIALLIGAIVASGLTVHELRAVGPSCVDYICMDDDDQCDIDGLDCNACHTDERCGIIIEQD